MVAVRNHTHKRTTRLVTAECAPSLGDQRSGCVARGQAGLSLNDDSYDDGDSQTTAIASAPLTAGVGALDDNWASSLTVNSPATTLVFTADDDTVPLVGVQQMR